MAEENGGPLLKPVYYEGCPGCEVDKLKDNNSGIPYRFFIHVWFITLSAALPISSLFPFLYFMIRDLHVAKRVEDIGFYAGFVGSSFMLGRALTSVFWGTIADRYGRKPVIVIGMITVVIFNTLFGLSTSYWMAILTRFLLGSLNGLLGPIKAYSVEVARPEHQAIGISLVSTAWGMGLVVGPSIGGLLAQFLIMPPRTHGGHTPRSISRDPGDIIQVCDARPYVGHVLKKSFVDNNVTRLLGSHFRGAILDACTTFDSMPRDERETLWQRFQSEYSWPQEETANIRAAWKATMNRRGHGPDWIAPAIWDGLLVQWLKPEWQEKSEKAKKNRETLKDGTITKHSGERTGSSADKNRIIYADTL